MSDILADIERVLDRYHRSTPLLVHGTLLVARQEIKALMTAVENLTVERNLLSRALEDLAGRCDGPDGVLKNGENIPTHQAHAALGHFDDGEDR
jgi:hypothetical protein